MRGRKHTDIPGLIWQFKNVYRLPTVIMFPSSLVATWDIHPSDYPRRHPPLQRAIEAATKILRDAGFEHITEEFSGGATPGYGVSAHGGRSDIVGVYVVVGKAEKRRRRL